MSDPEQLPEKQPGALSQLLVTAARDEEPPASLLERTLGSLGDTGVAVGAGLTSASSTSKATTVSSAGATVSASPAPGAVAGTGILSAKYAGLAALSVLATGLALDTIVPSMKAPSPAQSAAQGSARLVASVDAQPRAAAPEPERRRTSSPALPLSDRAEPDAPASTRDGTPPPDAPSSSLREEATGIDGARETDATQRGGPSSLLRQEAAVIDEAREAVATGDAVRALRALQAHRRRFARPLFQPEALYLEMQALRLRGDERAARLVAQQLLAAYPNGTQASAARAFLKDATAEGPGRAAGQR